MARKRIDLGSDADDRITALVARGTSGERIAEILGVSPATARRRVRELRGGVAAARVERRKATAPSREPLPENPEDIPPETGLAQIEYWLEIAKRNAKDAEVEGHDETMIKMVRLAAMLLEAKRKATPIAKPDPNDSPDFLAAAARVRERWHALLNKVNG